MYLQSCICRLPPVISSGKTTAREIERTRGPGEMMWEKALRESMAGQSKRVTHCTGARRQIEGWDVGKRPGDGENIYIKRKNMRNRRWGRSEGWGYMRGEVASREWRLAERWLITAQPETAGIQIIPQCHIQSPVFLSTWAHTDCKAHPAQS